MHLFLQLIQHIDEHQPEMATVFYRRSGGRFAEIERTQIKKKLHRANESLNFPQCWFSNRDNVIFPIQRKIVRKKIKKEKYNSSILKDDFSSRTGTDLSIFPSIILELFEQLSNKSS